MSKERFRNKPDVSAFYHHLPDIHPPAPFQTPAYTINRINTIIAKGKEQAKLIPSQLQGIWAFGLSKWLETVTQYEPDSNKRITQKLELRDLIVQE